MPPKPTYDELVQKIRKLEQLLFRRNTSPRVPLPTPISSELLPPDITNEESYRSILDLAPEAIVISLFKNDRYLHVNRAFCKMTGYTTAEVLGRNSLELNLFAEIAHRNLFMALISAKGRFDGLECTYRNKAGNTLECLVSARIVMFHRQKCLLVMATEITQLKEMEAKFLQAQKMEAVGSLAGGIAHDFNNILMGIQGHCSLMRMEVNIGHPCLEKLKGIEKLIKSGTALTQQLLSIAKGGHYEVKPSDINQILSTSADLFGRTHKDLRIEKQFHNDLWTVEVDRNQIEQVFLNLFVNACHAMPNGGRLWLETQNVELEEYITRPYELAPGKFVMICVADSGTGMDEVTRQKAFDPFFTTKPSNQGTGLGLASAYAIIHNHQGIIQVKSQVGAGTTFTIYLPVTDTPVAPDSIPTQEILLGNETLLLIDDEETIIQIGYELLTRLGYQVITAQDGTKAVEIYRTQNKEISLVILDMVMPEMSGGETFDRLKEINPDVRVLLSSGYSLNGQVQSILNRGCSGFIQKPFTLTNLSQKVRELLL